MKSNIKKILLFFFLLVLTLFILAFFTMPKFLIIEKILLQRGIYILAEDVEEGLFHVKLSKVQAYSKQSRIGSFDSIGFYLRPFYLLAKGKCGEGQLEVKVFPSKKVQINGKNLRCFEKLYVNSINVEFKDYILGRAEFSSLKLPNLTVEEIKFNFKGRSFDAEAKTFGMSLVGGGVVSFGREVSINGQLTGIGTRFLISGPLSSPSFEVQR
ncbi:hypothetical protein [Thermocrinis sp.]